MLLCSFFRFQPIQTRHGIRGTIAEKYVELFSWYEADLEEVQQIYERHKVNGFLCVVCVSFVLDRLGSREIND